MSEIEAAWRPSESAHTTRHGPLGGPSRDYAAVVATPWLGVMLGVTIRGAVVTSIDFMSAGAVPYVSRSEIAEETVRQLRAYFRDPSHRFTLPHDPAGTPFRLAVWEIIRRIPVGETRSYGDLARQLGSSPRAVGGACRANPIPLIIPCHRVVAAQGMGGFMGVTAGRGIELKQRLLAHEVAA
jgi:methylated-DNA-[protein]-cysteine S-methyltransferase